MEVSMHVLFDEIDVFDIQKMNGEKEDKSQQQQ